VICDFENPSLYLGKVTKDEPATKSSFLLVKNPAGTEILEVTTSSEFIKAEMDDFTSNDGRYEKRRVEVTAMPGLPLGRINETVTLKTNLKDKPTAVLRLSGSVIGDIEVTPEWMTFVVADRSTAKPANLTKKVFINNHVKGATLEILEVTDAAGYLDLSLKPLSRGMKYELTAVLKTEAIPDQGSISGNVVLTTNFPSQRELAIRYSAVRRSQKSRAKDKKTTASKTGKKDIGKAGKRHVGAKQLKEGASGGMFATPSENDPFADGVELFGEADDKSEKALKDPAGKKGNGLKSDKEKNGTTKEQEQKSEKKYEATKG